MWLKIYILLTCILLASCAASGPVNDAGMAPASFASPENEIVSRIDFPDVDFEGELVIRCAVPVSRTGRARPLFIYASPIERELFSHFEGAVFDALDGKIEFVPAVYQGRNVDVWFNFSVTFFRNSDIESVSIHPSSLSDADSYGPDYYGPQRVMRSSFFPAACRKSQVRMWMAANISHAGLASNARTIAGNGTDICKSELVEGLQVSEFIPASSEGQFVEGTYVEAWFTNTMGRTEIRPFSRVRR